MFVVLLRFWLFVVPPFVGSISLSCCFLVSSCLCVVVFVVLSPRLFGRVRLSVCVCASVRLIVRVFVRLSVCLFVWFVGCVGCFVCRFAGLHFVGFFVCPCVRVAVLSFDVSRLFLYFFEPVYLIVRARLFACCCLRACLVCLCGVCFFLFLSPFCLFIRVRVCARVFVFVCPFVCRFVFLCCCCLFVFVCVFALMHAVWHGLLFLFVSVAFGFAYASGFFVVVLSRCFCFIVIVSVFVVCVDFCFRSDLLIFCVCSFVRVFV